MPVDRYYRYATTMRCERAMGSPETPATKGVACERDVEARLARSLAYPVLPDLPTTYSTLPSTATPPKACDSIGRLSIHGRCDCCCFCSLKSGREKSIVSFLGSSRSACILVLVLGFPVQVVGGVFLEVHRICLLSSLRLHILVFLLWRELSSLGLKNCY